MSLHKKCECGAEIDIPTQHIAEGTKEYYRGIIEGSKFDELHRKCHLTHKNGRERICPPLSVGWQQTDNETRPITEPTETRE